MMWGLASTCLSLVSLFCALYVTLRARSSLERMRRVVALNERRYDALSQYAASLARMQSVAHAVGAYVGGRCHACQGYDPRDGRCTVLGRPTTASGFCHWHIRQNRGAEDVKADPPN